MFPWVDGFHWTFGHILFLSLFFAVVLTIVVTVLSAARRTVRNLRGPSAAELCWKADFAELPELERRCRHELAGRVKSRTCDNAFDCRPCSQYPQFATLPAAGMVHDLWIQYSNDRFYHRGHTWVEVQEDGTATVGLDGLAERLIGSPDSVEMPKVGDEIELNRTAWRMSKNGNEIRVRAPIEGKVLATGDPKGGWYLKIAPRLDPRDPTTLRHLLRGAEVHWWMYRELERLQLQLRTPNSAPSLADGGVLMNGLMDAMPGADWDTVLAGTFLEA
jgi:Glycine cleavage H-protein